MRLLAACLLACLRIPSYSVAGRPIVRLLAACLLACLRIPSYSVAGRQGSNSPELKPYLELCVQSHS